MTDTQQQQYRITPSHMARRAVVYVRQSGYSQVRHNTESTRLQRALADRARDLGWKDVEVIDADLGSSASVGAAPRQGFDRLVASVACSEVGIVFSREVSRLARTDKDFCHLLEVCQVFGTLLGDEERLYDLDVTDDLLVLGIKGTLSVVELRILRMRLEEARLKKAGRGELSRLLPPGYVYDASGQVVKDPDRRVREAMALVFDVFRRTGSIRQTFMWFRHEGIELPVNKFRGGKRQLVWQPPKHCFVGTVLRNPWYAGAYVWGRRTTRTVLEDGRLVRRQGGGLEAEDCRVFIKDHHEGYLTWDEYDENRRMIRRNGSLVRADESVAAVRKGQALLAGLLRCGRCGRRLHVRYSGRAGTAARYFCDGDYQAGGRYCIAFGGAMVDRRFAKELTAVLSPLGLDASLQAIERLCDGQDAKRRALENQLEQLRYDADRAFEQYDEVDPRNRLVAAELERRWNEALARAADLEAELLRLDEEAGPPGPEEREAIMALGRRFEHVWRSDDCPVELKKRIVRTVVEELVVDEDEEAGTLGFVVHWKGGCHTAYEMARPRAGQGERTSQEDIDIIRTLAVRYGDGEIARVLTKLGRRTGKGNRWNQDRVKSARCRAKPPIPGRSATLVDPEVLTLNGAARHCGVSDTTITRLVKRGLLTNHQTVPWAPWEIRRSDLESDPVRGMLDHLRQTGRLVLDRCRHGSQ